MNNNSDCNLIKNFLPYQLYKIEEETNIIDFANKNKTTINNCIYEKTELRKGDYVIIKSAQYNMHVVRPGEDLFKIAAKYNKTIEELILLNKTNKLFIGQQLFV